MSGDVKNIHTRSFPSNAGAAPVSHSGKARPQAAAGSGGGTDSVSITPTASQLRVLQATLTGTPVVDQGRVEQVRESIAEGSYVVNPYRVATKFIQLETMLPG